MNAKGELGLGDKDQRKTFCVLNELREKRIKQCDIGKSGYVVAISEDIIDPAQSEINQVNHAESDQLIDNSKVHKRVSTQ